jgi:hypothetical protein
MSDTDDKYVVVLMHDPTIIEPTSGTSSGGGCLLSRPLSLQDARDNAQMRRNTQPKFSGKFLVCKVHESF